MSKKWKWILSVGAFGLVAIIIFQTINEDKGPGTEGTIILGNNGSIHIVLDSNFKDQDASLPLSEIRAKYKEVGRLSIHQSAYTGKLEHGQKVRVWINRVDESFPPIYRATHIGKM